MRLRSRPSQPRDRQKRAANKSPAQRRHPPPRHAQQPRRQRISLTPLASFARTSAVADCAFPAVFVGVSAVADCALFSVAFSFRE